MGHQTPTPVLSRLCGHKNVSGSKKVLKELTVGWAGSQTDPGSARAGPRQCGSQQIVEDSERDGNTRPPDLSLEKPIGRSGSNS